jgi:formylglycine-generating enzyme required for sulfatase activity
VKTVDPNSFVGLLRSKTGLSLDLPTEAQWEYACRAGTTSSYNNGGNTESDLATLGRYWDNRNDGRGGYSEHTTVGSYAPNAWGLYDMHGNVWESCLDWYGSLANGTDGTDPLGPVSGWYRVSRGGGWCYGASYCPSSYRDHSPSADNENIGFRVACSAGL